MSGITYKDAGVDIDAGSEMIERIKPAIENLLGDENEYVRIAAEEALG